MAVENRSIDYYPIVRERKSSSSLANIALGTAIGTASGFGFGYFAPLTEDSFVKQHIHEKLTPEVISGTTPSAQAEVKKASEDAVKIFSTHGNDVANKSVYENIAKNVKNANVAKYLKMGVIYSLIGCTAYEILKAVGGNGSK